MAVPGLYIPIRGDYSEFQKDMARLRGIAREEGTRISEALQMAISPKDAIVGLTKIGAELKKLTAAAQSTGRTLNAPVEQLTEFAQKANVAASVVEELHYEMLKTARDRQLESALRSLQKQCGLTEDAVARLQAHMGDTAGSIDTAMKALGVRSAQAIKKEMASLEASFDHAIKHGNLTIKEQERLVDALEKKWAALNAEMGVMPVKHPFFAAKETLGVRETGDVMAEARQARQAYETIQQSAWKTREMSVASHDAMIASLKKLAQELRLTASETSKFIAAFAGSRDALDSAMGSAGLRSTRAIRQEIAEVNRLLHRVESSASATLEDKERMRAWAVNRTDALTREMRMPGQLTANERYEQATGLLGMKTDAQYRQQAKGIVQAYLEVKTSARSSAEDVQRAHARMIESFRRLREEMNSWRPQAPDISTAFSTLNVRSTATIKAEIEALRAAFARVRADASSTGEDVRRAFASMSQGVRTLQAELNGPTYRDKLHGFYHLLGIRSPQEIEDDKRNIIRAYQEVINSISSAEGKMAAFAARTDALQRLSREAGTWQDPARAQISPLRQRYDTLASQVGRASPSFSQFESRTTARNAVSAFQELNGRLPRAREIREIAAACGASASQIRRMRDELDHSSSAFKALIGYGQVWMTFGFVHTAQDFIKTAMALENVKVAFTAIYGTSDMAEKKLDYVLKVSDQLGLSFLATAEGAKKLFAAANGTPVEEHANMVFRSFSEMSAAMRLTSDETKGVFLALSQMISKGKVSAEELRQQLAERMPGAVNLFAKSIGVTTQELDKMLQKGEVSLEHFVKFSAEVGKTYAAGAQMASHSLQAELNRLGTTWTKFQADSVNTGALSEGVRQINAMLKGTLDIITKLAPHTEMLFKTGLAAWIAASLIPGGKLNAMLAGLATVTGKCTKAILTFAAATKAAILGAGSLKTAVKALGSAMVTMAKNPAFLALLAAGVIAFKVFEDNAEKAKSGFSDVSDSMDELIKKRIELEDATKKSNFTPEFKRESLAKDTNKNFKDWEENFAKMESSARQKLDSLRTPSFWGDSDDDALYANKAEGYRVAFERLRAWEEEAKKASSSNNLDKINEVQTKLETGWDGLTKTLKDVYGLTDQEINEIGKSAVKLDGYIGTAFANSSRILDTYAKETISAAKSLGLNLDALKKTYDNLAKAASSTDFGKAFADMKNFNGLKEALGQTDMAFDHSVAVVGGYKDTIAGLAKDLAGANEKYDEAREKVIDMSLGFEDAGKQGNNYRAALDGLDKQTALVNQTQNEFINAINNAINAAGGSGPAFSAMSDFIRQVGVQAGFTTDQINGFIDRLHAMRQAALAAINVKWAGDLEKQNIDREFQRQYKAERKAKNKAGMQKIREQHFAWKQGVSVDELSSGTKGQIGKSVGLDLADDADAEASRKGGRGGGGGKRVDNTQEKYHSAEEGWRKKIADMQGQKDVQTLAKDFADMDKQLKGSSVDLKALKKDYYEAFNAHSLHEFEKTMFQLVGNEKALADIDIEEKLKAQQAQFDGMNKAAQELGLATVDYTAKMEAYRKALENNKEEQYLQKLIPVYEEIASKDEDKVKILELQNKLIGIQAEKMLGSFPPEVVERWREMQMLEHSRNPWDGIVLGLKKYSMETESLAKTMSSAVGQAFDGMADAFTQFVMTGKLSFKDMANSIIADLMRITVKSMILGPIANAIGGALGSLFNGTGQGMSFSGTGAAESASLGLGRHGHAKGDVFTGLHGYSNQIVSRPTLFSYGSQLTRFAKGGVMGEAGPEAVMPLTRMGNGNLGVQAAGGGAIELSLTIVDKTQGGVGVENTQAQQNGLKLDVIVQQIDSKLAGLAASGKSKLVGAMEKTHRMPSTRGW